MILAEKKSPNEPKWVNPWQTDKKKWEYVSIPEENALGEPHAPIMNNEYRFEAGKTYLVPPEVAVDIKDRLKVYAKATVRILQPKRDIKSENQVSTGTMNPAGSAIDVTNLGAVGSANEKVYTAA